MGQWFIPCWLSNQSEWLLASNTSSSSDSAVLESFPNLLVWHLLRPLGERYYYYRWISFADNDYHLQCCKCLEISRDFVWQLIDTKGIYTRVGSEFTYSSLNYFEVLGTTSSTSKEVQGTFGEFYFEFREEVSSSTFKKYEVLFMSNNLSEEF